MRSPVIVLLTALALYLPAQEAAGPTRTADGGQFLASPLPLLSLTGDAATLGRQAGELTGARTQAMLRLLNRHPTLAGLRASPVLSELRAAIAPEQSEEILAWAQAAQVDGEALLLANLAVDVLCTAVVRLPVDGHPLQVARNMDFSPDTELGRLTVTIARRPVGRRATLSIGWPGYAGIVSGMNDAGVSACLLLNHAAKRNASGDPMGLRLRALLERADDLPTAIALFAAAPIRSANYVLLADATTAAVVWWGEQGLRRVDPTRDGWLFCTNARIAEDTGLPTDPRGLYARELADTRRLPDLTWLRGLLTATYLRDLNAQAMVLVPATRALHLATNDGKPAALSTWYGVDGARLMAGAALDQVPVTVLEPVKPFPHYTQK